MHFGQKLDKPTGAQFILRHHVYIQFHPEDFEEFEDHTTSSRFFLYLKQLKIPQSKLQANPHGGVNGWEDYN